MMKTFKAIQLVAAGALALGLNGTAAAGAINLNTSVNYSNSSANSKMSEDYYSFTLGSLSNVLFKYTNQGLLSTGPGTLSIYQDLGTAGPSPINKDTLGSTASIASGTSSWSVSRLAAGNYYLLVDAWLPGKPKGGSETTGSFTLTSYTATPAVPEPSTYALLLAGVGLVGFMSYRRQRYFS